MFVSIADWFSNNIGPLMDHLDNEALIAHMTSPIGLGVFIALMVFCLIMKWRISFVVLATMLAGIYVVRYTITDTSARHVPAARSHAGTAAANSDCASMKAA